MMMMMVMIIHQHFHFLQVVSKQRKLLRKPEEEKQTLSLLMASGLVSELQISFILNNAKVIYSNSLLLVFLCLQEGRRFTSTQR